MIIDPDLLRKVRETSKWKKSNIFCANRLGISIETYEQYRTLERKVNCEDGGPTFTGEDIEFEKTPPVDKVEFSQYNVNIGTGVIKGTLDSEPLSAEDIEKRFKIDTAKWRLASYWNKQKPSGGYFVSANIVAVKPSEMSKDDLDSIISKTLSGVTKARIMPPLGPTNNKALCVYLSDRHIGAKVYRSIYDNEYNSDNYEGRLWQVLNEIAYLTSTYGVFEEIYVIDLGDRMDGQNSETTRGGHKLPQNMDNIDSFETAISADRVFFDTLLQSGYSQKYQVINLANSNHGGFFDYVVSRSMEMYLNAKYPDVTTHTVDTFIKHFDIGRNHTLILTHGKDTEDMKFAMPLHLNDKTESFINKYLIQKGIDPKNTKVSLVKGDIHIDNSQEAVTFRYRNVASLFGGSKWIHHNFGPCKPGISFDVFELNSDRVFPYYRAIN